MTEDAVKGIQTALWAALVLVQMGVVGCLEVRAETVHREVTYEAVEDEAALPEEIMVSVLAGHDGEMVPCQAVGRVEEAAYWQDDFSFPITFYEYAAVDKAQTEPDIATAINAQAPGVLARYATKRGAYLIHLSTDYVFDGLGIAAKTEDDSISPINVYGKTKAIAEQAIFEQKCKACVLRLTWVYGVNHPNFVTGTVKKLLSGQQVMAFEDQVGSPTAATDIAEVIIKLIINHENSVTITGLYHFANSGYCSRFECARFIEKCLGERATGMISAIQTSSVKLVAARPLNCRLQTLKIQNALNVTPRSWQEAMVEAVDYLTPQW